MKIKIFIYLSCQINFLCVPSLIDKSQPVIIINIDVVPKHLDHTACVLTFISTLTDRPTDTHCCAHWQIDRHTLLCTLTKGQTDIDVHTDRHIHITVHTICIFGAWKSENWQFLFYANTSSLRERLLTHTHTTIAQIKELREEIMNDESYSSI